MGLFEYYEGVTLDVDTEIEFGKYQGMTVEDILEEDAQYIEWLNDQGIEVTEEVQALLDE